MSYTVRGYFTGRINLAPATTEEEVLQNVAIIISTRQGTVPLARDLGLPQSFIDKPVPVARNIFVKEITEAVSAYEPRAEVAGITFETDENEPGKLIPILEVNVING